MKENRQKASVTKNPGWLCKHWWASGLIVVNSCQLIYEFIRLPCTNQMVQQGLAVARHGKFCQVDVTCPTWNPVAPGNRSTVSALLFSLSHEQSLESPIKSLLKLMCYYNPLHRSRRFINQYFRLTDQKSPRIRLNHHPNLFTRNHVMCFAEKSARMRPGCSHWIWWPDVYLGVKDKMYWPELVPRSEKCAGPAGQCLCRGLQATAFEMVCTGGHMWVGATTSLHT